VRLDVGDAPADVVRARELPRRLRRVGPLEHEVFARREGLDPRPRVDVGVGIGALHHEPLVRDLAILVLVVVEPLLDAVAVVVTRRAGAGGRKSKSRKEDEESRFLHA
jgi:hypothetical protein